MAAPIKFLAGIIKRSSVSSSYLMGMATAAPSAKLCNTRAKAIRRSRRATPGAAHLRLVGRRRCRERRLYRALGRQGPPPLHRALPPPPSPVMICGGGCCPIMMQDHEPAVRRPSAQELNENCRQSRRLIDETRRSIDQSRRTIDEAYRLIIESRRPRHITGTSGDPLGA